MTATTHPLTAAAAASTTPGRTFLRAPFAARTWRSLGYVAICLPIAVLGFALTIACLAVGVVTVVTFIGLPLTALCVLGARSAGRLHRSLGRAMIGATVADPQPFRPAPGFFGWLRSALRDGVGWRAAAYLVLKFVLLFPGAALSLFVWVEAVWTFLYPVWWQLVDPVTIDANDVARHSGLQIGTYYFDTWPRALLASATGLVAIWLAPWPARAVASIDRSLIAWLLGPGGGDARVRELEETRAHAVDDAAASLRRIERDLHDGTQARLVALAMTLGEAREALETRGSDPEGAAATDRIRRLVGEAHDTAKESLAELREVVRGFHPPVLDQGLEPALATLSARSATPVELQVQLTAKPAGPIETIAYFCAAELLTNVARHSGASHATIQAWEAEGMLTLVVSDNGHGGAQPGGGTGLTGLAERVRTVDGRLYIDSPPGGPTSITVVLPERV